MLRPVPSQAHAALVHRLGGAACVLSVPAGGNASLMEVGALCGLPVWSLMAPPGEVRRHVQFLARHGRLGVVFADDATHDRMLVAIAIAPVRVVAISTGDPDPLALRRLAQAARCARPTQLEQAIAFAEAIDVDAAGRRTFRLLYQLLERAVELLPARVPRDDRHAWALTQITRLLFLRFVEAEGWLDGNPRFLMERFDACLAARRDPTRHLLHPLFFGTLNKPGDTRSRFARAFGAIPFLNGGLFEPHTLERLYSFRLPAAYWRDAFDAVVGRVDVTLDGNAEDGRVTPELLSRVFEGVMDADERKREGAFFTPPALVDAVLREALACHLAPRLRRSERMVARALDDPDPDLARMLLDITVLDPAAGSGAFLVGALALLHGPGPRDPIRVRHLVTRRLFGVDRHPGAVRLCELRLWLEVLRAMRGKAPAKLPPLPNLDATIRAGDSLIDPLFGLALGGEAARAIRVTQRAITTAHGSAKRTALSDVRRVERRAMLAALKEGEASLDARIREVLESGRAPTLFGDRRGLQSASRKELASLRRKRIDVRRDRHRLTRDSAAAPFALEVAFAPVLARRGGFDLVVGNPPWVRAERLPASMRASLAQRYRWWRSSGGGWRHLPDLSVAFVERGFELLRPGGTLAQLVPAKLATADYAGAARGGLASRAVLHRVADLGRDPRAGFEATTYPLAVVASRRVPHAGHLVRLGLETDAPGQPQAAWRASGRWSLGSPDVQRLAQRLAARHPRLLDAVTPQLGVKTGANAVFLNPPSELAEWARPALRGRDVRAFHAESHVTMLWPADARGAAQKSLPEPVARYLAGHRARLEARADVHGGPWWQLFRTRAATAPHRVVWSDLARELRAAMLTDAEVVPLNSCYVIAVTSEVVAASLAAWLNSTWIRSLARMAAEPASGGCARFAARAVGSVPLPEGALASSVLAGFTYAAIDCDVQAPLDEHVADLLGLDDHDRASLLTG